MKQNFKILSIALFVMVMSSIVAGYTGFDPIAAFFGIGSLLVISSLFADKQAALFTSADVSAISNYAHQWKRQLIVALVNSLDIVNDITVLPGIKSSMKLPKLIVNGGFRPYSATKEFKTGDLKFTDRELKVGVGKREILIDPEDFRHKYFSLELSPGSGASTKKIPFEQYIWQEVLKSVKAEINNITAYFGYDPTGINAWLVGTAYTAGDRVTRPVNGVTEYFEAQGATTGDDPALDDGTNWVNVTAGAVAPGIKSYLDDLITAATISEVATGAITDGATAVAAFKELYRSQSPAYKNIKTVIHASYTDVEFYMDGIEDKISKYTTPEVSTLMKAGLIPILGTNGMGWIKPATWLGSSRRLICEPLNGMKGASLVMGTDLLSDANDIATQPDLWTLIAGLKMVLGFQIGDPDAVKVNDQE